MPLNIDPALEASILTLAGIDPATVTVDPGSLDIQLLNPAGSTTVRATFVLSVDTDELKQRIIDSITE